MNEQEEQSLPVLWGRHDLPSHESCRLVRRDAGWEITGVTVLACEGRACRLDYEIICDKNWTTHSAIVSGWYGPKDIDITIIRDNLGQWHLNGQIYAELADCVDIDLNF